MPIRPVEFQILLTLAGGERHGYGIMQEVSRLSDGDLRIDAGTLYRALYRMLTAGWVAESSRRVPSASVAGRKSAAHPGEQAPRNGEQPRREYEERRRYYRLTPLGRRTAAAEAARLERLVGAALASRLLTRG